MSQQLKQGRPPTYDIQKRMQYAELIREHGVRRTQELTSEPICISTLVKIAREYGIELKKGRRPRKAA